MRRKICIHILKQLAREKCRLSMTLCYNNKLPPFFAQMNSVSPRKRVRRKPLKFDISRTKASSKNSFENFAPLIWRISMPNLAALAIIVSEISTLQTDSQTDSQTHRLTDRKTTLITYVPSEDRREPIRIYIVVFYRLCIGEIINI